MLAQLRGSEHDIVLRTLELFAYGTWMEYSAAPHTFLPLDDRQKLKLRQLTMCSLASARVRTRRSNA